MHVSRKNQHDLRIPAKSRPRVNAELKTSVGIYYLATLLLCGSEPSKLRITKLAKPRTKVVIDKFQLKPRPLAA